MYHVLAAVHQQPTQYDRDDEGGSEQDVNGNEVEEQAIVGEILSHGDKEVHDALRGG